MFGSQTVDRWLFIKLFPNELFDEQTLYNLVLDIKSPMLEIYNRHVYNLLLTFLSNWRREDKQWYKKIYESYLNKCLLAKNRHPYKQIVEWIMRQCGRDMWMYDQLVSFINDILTQLQQ